MGMSFFVSCHLSNAQADPVNRGADHPFTNALDFYPYLFFSFIIKLCLFPSHCIYCRPSIPRKGGVIDFGLKIACYMHIRLENFPSFCPGAKKGGHFKKYLVLDLFLGLDLAR